MKATDIARNGRYSVTALRETDIPALDYGMTNVTAKGDGYRFLPHGNHFEGKGATVKIKYDRTRIPSGFTEDDINTYYFDQDTRHWVALERVKVDKATACVVLETTSLHRYDQWCNQGTGISTDRRIYADDDE